MEIVYKFNKIFPYIISKMGLSDTIFDAIDTLLEGISNYDEYSAEYQEELIEALTKLYIVSFTLGNPILPQDDIAYEKYRITKLSEEYAKYQFIAYYKRGESDDEFVSVYQRDCRCTKK
jgi:hypothetical protein